MASYLTESTLQGTTALRDHQGLRPIPEDRSDGNSSTVSRRADSMNIMAIMSMSNRHVAQNDGNHSIVASSTGGVVDDKPQEQPYGAKKTSGQPHVVPIEDTNQLARATPRCNWKILAIVAGLLLAGAVGGYVISNRVFQQKDKNSSKSSGDGGGSSTGNSPDDSPRPAPTPPPTNRQSTIEDFLNQISGESLRDPRTPQSSARRWIRFQDEAKLTLVTDGSSRVMQRYALATLYYSTGGEAWADNTGYLTGEHECTWKGVVCVDNSVTEIHLPNHNLNGTIPKEVTKIPWLRRFDLSENALYDKIPSSLWSAAALRSVYLHNNQLEGTIKTKMWKLLDLEELLLYNNSLTGTLPDIHTKRPTEFKLRGFDVRNNGLVGQIPGNYSKLSNLQGFLISDNQITGTIPEALYQHTNLRWLFLANNRLTGTLSESIWSLPSLQVARLGTNRLSGTIPSIPLTASQPNLRGIDLCNNTLTGTLPTGLFQIRSLQGLLIQNNTLTGTIPSIPSPSVLSLNHIDLGRNRLSGTLPPELWDLPELEFLDLYINRFNGSLPAFPPTKSLQLKTLWLQNNSFTGDLPVNWSPAPDIGKCAENQSMMIKLTERTIDRMTNPIDQNSPYPFLLTTVCSLQRFKHPEDVVLYGNQFRGNIPQSLFDLVNLTSVDLSENSLTGPLPSLQATDNLEFLYLNNNTLEGPLPSHLPETLQELWLNSNNFTGPIPAGFGTTCANLTVARLQDNSLSGSVSTETCTATTWVQLETDCLDTTAPNFVSCDCCTECF